MRQIRQDLLTELRHDVESHRTSVSSAIHTDDEPHVQLDEHAADATIADMLDFLSKELNRLQAKQTIDLFVFLADRHRCQREAKESGCRAKSIERQQLIDDVFRQVCRTHLARGRTLMKVIDVLARRHRGYGDLSPRSHSSIDIRYSR